MYKSVTTVFAMATTLLIAHFALADLESLLPDPPSSPTLDTHNDLPDGHPRGTLTMVERKTGLRNTVQAIIDVKLPDDEKVRVASGENPWRHPNGSLLSTVGCGERVNRVQLSEYNGEMTLLTPCSRELDSPGLLARRFGSGQLSPNKKLLAVESYFYKGRQTLFNVMIFRDQKIIHTIGGRSPTWVDNDTYIFTRSDGLFIVDVGAEPVSVNSNIINSVGNSDVSADGERLVFEWNQQLWTMNIDGSGLSSLHTGPLQYNYPVWSPDGDFVSFLATGGNAASSQKVYYLDIKRNKLWSSVMSSQIKRFDVLDGPLSWIR